MTRFYSNLHHKLGLAIAVGMVSLPAWSDSVVCIQDQLTRKIEVLYLDPELALPCEVLYDKQEEGSQSILWRAENAQGYCEEKARQLVQKHRTWGWQCSEKVKIKSHVSTLEEVTGASTKP